MPIGKNSWERLPNYSTDIAAAWSAWERFGKDGWVLSLSHDPQHPKQKVLVLMKPRTQNLSEVVSSGESVPHAICLALIEAVG